ncbi:hypothetical protein WDZ92_46545, partial [Nostoc sp. NIES-2111]
ALLLTALRVTLAGAVMALWCTLLADLPGSDLTLLSVMLAATLAAGSGTLLFLVVLRMIEPRAISMLRALLRPVGRHIGAFSLKRAERRRKVVGYMRVAPGRSERTAP